ncbi:MAG: GTPase HflX [Alphaproteobacteria bacterium]|nr:GTPase HflX [Alphaproteobacteria bacterium]
MNGEAARSPEARLEEAVGLARAIHLDVVRAEIVRISRPRPATLFGEGSVEHLGECIKDDAIELVIVDGALSPVQQRNLEKSWQAKVIDRTGLILEIFGERACTHEGRLQVELAALSYQRSRLVRSWTHLERQRGGFGFLGGPGESQLEIDRRLIGERIARLKRELDGIKRTRALHREARRRVPYPVVALVGYTNAGKSTLFNRLTRSAVMADDMLFATLDPTMRRVELPSGRTVILSDTVGFISELPTHLVAAFRATLEEVTEADLVIHVRDAHHPDSEAQRQDVLAVLADLGLPDHGLDDPGLDGGGDQRIIEAMNKIDLLDAAARAGLKNQMLRDPDRVALSAATGEGCDDLLSLIDRRLEAGTRPVRLDIPLSDGSTLAWVYRHGEVLGRRDDNDAAHLSVRLSEADIARLRHHQRAH